MKCFSRLLRTARDSHGMTLMEVIVVLGVVGVMAATLSPMVLNYLEDAKLSKAESDVKIIGQSIINLTRDVAHFPIFKDGTKTTGDPDIELLRGPGADPVDHDTVKWLATSKVGELEDHLVKNNPGGTKYSTSGRRFFWQGPYLEKITEDPWGNRYLVNIKHANPADTPAKVVWVLSAGSNGKIETDPTSLADSGPTPGGDDIVVRVK